MNKYQKQIYKEIRRLRRDRLQELDEKYPRNKRGLRNWNYVVGAIRLEGNKLFREIKRQAKENLKR